MFHIRFDTIGLPGEGPIFTLTQLIRDFYDDIKGILPTTYTVRFAGEAQGVGAEQGDTFEADPWTVTGTAAFGYAPPADALLVKWSALTGGRRGRGKTYLGPLTIWALEDNGTPKEEVRSSVQAAADALVSASLSDLNGAVGVYSRVDGLFRDFASATVPNSFASLRSRRD